MSLLASADPGLPSLLSGKDRVLRAAQAAARLASAGAPALAALGRERLLAAWGETVEAFRDPGSPERRALDPDLARHCGLSRPGLAAGLEAVLGGVRREAAERLLATLAVQGSEVGVREEEAGRATADHPAAPRPVLVVLAANLPALAVQPLLPALLAGRPVILKSPSAEPLFAAAFAAALARREPSLADAVAALTWPGGDAGVEAAVLSRVGLVLAYGEQATLDDLTRRSPVPVVGFGPRTSLAILGREVEPAAAAAGLARDIALFDQRGCLSVAAVYTAGDAEALARELARALAAAAQALPPGPFPADTAAAVQQIRAESELRGLVAHRLPLAAGTVIVEPAPAFRPSPGLRLVRVHGLADLGTLPEILAPWSDRQGPEGQGSGRLQGAALAGSDAWALAEELAALGFSRFAAPGELQSPDATWQNGGMNPLALFARGGP
jgi:acyl-CoA reductase LuxC